MSTFLSQQNTQNTVTLGVGTVPTGAAIVVNGVSTPGIGSITATGITLHAANVNWTNQTTAIYPSNVTGLLQCGDGIGNDPGPCDTFAMNRNLRTPYVENWTLGIQHAFSGKLSIESTYVGNHAVKLPGVVDLNQPAVGSGWSAAEITACYQSFYNPNNCGSDGGAEAAARPFTMNGKAPYLGHINYLSNFYGSTYHGLQNTLTARNYHGLDFVLGYTFSHALDDLSSNWVAFLPMDSARPFLDHASGDEDIRHRFTFSVTYTLPEMKTKSQLLEGWQVNTIITLQSGQPWNVNDQALDLSGTGELADRWNFFGNPSDFKSQGPNGLPMISAGSFTLDANGNVTGVASGAPAGASTCFADASIQAAKNMLGFFGCYANGKSALLPPPLGTFGTMGRNIFRDTGFRNVDLSVSKNFKFGERMKAQFRVETFNIFNHPNFANPNGATSGYGQGATADPSTGAGSFGCGCATPDNAAFNPVLGSGSNRAIQLGLKFIF
jgi:hypothetical protein